MQFLRIALYATLLCVTATSAGHSQAANSLRRTPAGMWLSAGLGGGWTRVSCAICGTDRNLGPAGYLRVGTTLRPGLLMAVEANGWTRDDEDIRSNVVTGGVVAQLYPDPDGGLFLRGGLAYVRFSAAEQERDDDGVGANLFGLLMGAGYEFPIGRGVNVTNYASLLASSFGSLNTEGGTAANDVSLTLLQVGIGITRH